MTASREDLMELVGQLLDYAEAATVETWPGSDGLVAYDPVQRLVNTLGQYAARESYYRSLAAKSAQSRAQEERRSFSRTTRAKARDRLLGASISELNSAHWLGVAQDLEAFCIDRGIEFDEFVPPANVAEASDDDFAAAEKALAEARARKAAILAA